MSRVARSFDADTAD